MGQGFLGMYDGEEYDEEESPPVEKAYCTHKCPICKLIVPKGDDCIKGCHVECYNDQYSNSSDDWGRGNFDAGPEDMECQ